MSLLKFDPALKKLLNGYDNYSVYQPITAAISTLSDIPLLLRLMSICPLNDLEMETIFTSIRSKLLASVLETVESFDLIRFQSALALQCFANEYV